MAQNLLPGAPPPFQVTNSTPRGGGGETPPYMRGESLPPCPKGCGPPGNGPESILGPSGMRNSFQLDC